MQNIQTKVGNKKLRSSYFSAIVSISLVLWMLGLLGLIVIDAKKISDFVKEHIQLNVFLHDDVEQADVLAFQKSLRALPYVKTARYVSKQEALDSLKKDLGEDAVSMLESNPLPASIDINLKADYAQADSLKNIQAFLMKNKLVREVTFQQTEVKRMSENFRSIAIVLLVFSSLLFFIAVALINNTIRLAMYSRRFLIKSMQLVGATKSFIRWPYLSKGILHGFYAGILSCILLSGIVYLIHNRFPELGQFSDLNLLFILFGSVLGAGIILSGISTFFAVNRYLRLSVDELY